MNNSPKFLKSVAEYLIKKSSDHRDTILVFPNKRSILFIRKYLKDEAKGVTIFPKLKTIGSFFSEMTTLKEASRIEQLFCLYDAYCEVVITKNQAPVSFDRFRFWGEMMLDDFDDVDRQLVNPVDVFTNTKRLEEIKTDFLDEDQREVARELWGYNPESFTGFKNNQHSKGDDDIVYQGFITLAEMLLPIYNRFHAILNNQGLTTRGMIARIAADNIERLIEAGDKIPQRVGFVGFSILSGAERFVFKQFRNSKRALFFWNVIDMFERDLPTNMKNYSSPLKKYINKLVSYFPMPDDFVLPKQKQTPQIDIVSVPSNVMQAKIAGNIIDNLNIDKEINPRRADNTAIVLPDVALLIPLLHSLTISPVNVTMGIPMRNTPFATLLQQIIRLNMSARQIGTDDTVYLTENVIRILSHPSLTTLAPEECAQLRQIIEKESRFVTHYSTILENTPKIAFIFEPLKDDNSANSAKNYLLQLIDNLIGLMIDSGALDNASEKLDSSKLHECKVLKAVRDAVENVIEIIDTHSRFLDLDTINRLSFFRLIEKQIMHYQLNMSGSPLVGVQIMGALETRSLDFDNVIMLSMNEKTFPPKNFMRSLIPPAIRAAYGLSTTEERELEFAWIYANLISRCKRAFLVYNAAAETNGNGGMSRYLFQTQYIYNLPNPRRITVLPNSHIENDGIIKIEKTDDVIRELNRFKSGGDRNLSVSDLEKFGNCSLSFYLSKVKRVKEPKITEPGIADSILGSIIHSIFQDIFNDIIKTNGGIVDSSFSYPEHLIRQKFVKYLGEEWYHQTYITEEDMPTEGQLQTDIWAPKIARIIEEEKKRAPFTVVMCEMSPGSLTGENTFDWHLSPELNIRFKFYIDRVDKLNENQLRFIDYKTGKESLSVADMDNLFWRSDNPENAPKPNKAIFQLLTYAYAYQEFMRQNGTPFDGQIILEIIKVIDSEKALSQPLKINNTIIKHHADMDSVPGFMDELTSFVSRIFDPKEPFEQTREIENCMFCQFKNICQRNPQKKF